MPALGASGRNLNDDVGTLVGNGLRVQIQQALDAVRVVGNNAVHPGQLDLKDDQATALMLFELMNIIVNDLITEPKRIADLYSRLPPNSLEAIQRRDG